MTKKGIHMLIPIANLGKHWFHKKYSSATWYSFTNIFWDLLEGEGQEHLRLFLMQCLFVGATSVFLNTLVLYTMWKRTRITSPLELYVAVLAAMDLIQGLVLHPWSIVSTYAHTWLFGYNGNSNNYYWSCKKVTFSVLSLTITQLNSTPTWTTLYTIPTSSPWIVNRVGKQLVGILLESSLVYVRKHF